MRLKQLHIDRQYWETGAPLAGHIMFDDNAGEISVKLDDAKCQQMLAIVADSMVEHSRKLANELTANVLLGVQALPGLAAPAMSEDVPL